MCHTTCFTFINFEDVRDMHMQRQHVHFGIRLGLIELELLIGALATPARSLLT